MSAARRRKKARKFAEALAAVARSAEIAAQSLLKLRHAVMRVDDAIPDQERS